MRKPREPSRLLNDQRAIFGLWMVDFAGAIGLFVFLSVILDGTKYSLLAMPAPFLFLIFLAPVRLTTRRMIIRDFLGYHFNSKVLYDPKK